MIVLIISNIVFNPIIEQNLLLLKKGVYPYEYMDSYDRFDETELPSKEKFYSKLADSHITDKEYEHA
jgi:hypothetical protein